MKHTLAKFQVTSVFAGLLTSGLLLTSATAQEDLKRALAMTPASNE